MGRCLIENYRNLPGEHCGSTAMRNLLFHYCGLDLSEAEVFGLGAGADCVLVETEEFEPGVLLFGRGPTLEMDAAAALGVDYSEQPEFDDARAWAVVREQVEAGRPTMLSGDVLHLDYRDFKVHFPAHRFVLLGYDDERRVTFVADRLEAAVQECSYEALARSRNPKDCISTYNTWGRFGGSDVRHDLSAAFARAIAANARRMLGGDAERTRLFEAMSAGRPSKVTAGVEALDRLAEVLPGLAEDERGGQVARYAAGCIESFGTGGGNFRNLYAGFLGAVRETEPELVPPDAPERARTAAVLWTEMAGQLRAFSKNEDRQALAGAARLASRLQGVESALFEGLAAADRI